MIANIFKLFAVLLFSVAATSAAQQPLDALPSEPLQDAPQDVPQDAPPPGNLDEPIRIQTDEPAPSEAFDDLDSDFADDEPDQKIEVFEKFSGWWAAGEGSNAGRLSKTMRANWVTMDANGLVKGSVVGVDGAETGEMLILLMNRGRLVTRTTADEYGDFKLNNVVEGAYSLIGFGENAFFCFGLNILHQAQTELDDVPAQIYATAFQNKTTINTDWIQYFAPRVVFRVYGRYSAGEDEGDPAEYFGFSGLATQQPAAVPATSISNHQVVKTADGRLLGRVHQFNSLNGRPVNIRNTKVMLLKGDEVFASTTTDNFGVFEFDATPEGQYGLVAASVDGLGCTGIDVVDPNPSSILAGEDSGATVFDFCMVTSETIGWLNDKAIKLAYERAILAPRQPELVRQFPPLFPPNRCQDKSSNRRRHHGCFGGRHGFIFGGGAGGQGQGVNRQGFMFGGSGGFFGPIDGGGVGNQVYPRNHGVYGADIYNAGLSYGGNKYGYGGYGNGYGYGGYNNGGGNGYGGYGNGGNGYGGYGTGGNGYGGYGTGGNGYGGYGTGGYGNGYGGYGNGYGGSGGGYGGSGGGYGGYGGGYGGYGNGSGNVNGGYRGGYPTN